MAYKEGSTGGSGGGDFVLIETKTASSSSEITFTDLSSTYFCYKVILFGIKPASDGNIFRLRTSSNNGSSYDAGASDYNELRFTNQMFPISATSSYITVTLSIGNDTNEFTSSEITIINPSAANRTVFLLESSDFRGATNYNMTNHGARRNSAADVDAIQFTMQTGNIGSGTFKLYGLVA